MLRFARLICAAGVLLTSAASVFGQSALQGGPGAPGHAPMYVGSGSPIVLQDSGTAGGGKPGVGLSELGVTARGTGAAPYVGQGNGPLGTNICDYDSPITNVSGYHYLCFSANAHGGPLIAYGAGGGATVLPLQIGVNGVISPFANITGITVGSTPVGGGTNGYLLYDNAGVLGNLAVLDVPRGGTGSSALTAHGVLLGEGSSAVGIASIGTAARLFVDRGAGNDPAFVAAAGDCTTAFLTTVNFTCTKTNGVAFAPSATTDTTNANNIASGVLGSSRGGAGAVVGALKATGTGVVSQASCSDLLGVAASCATDTTNATNIASGTLNAARLSSGVNANVLNTQALGYSIATTDCGKTVSFTGGPFTATLPAVAGFPAACVVQACNANANNNTSHAIRLSGWPAPSLGRLWMQQCQEVSINNGAWIVTKWPGKFRPGFIPTLFVDTAGSDSNDGLVSNAAGNPLQNVQTCWTIFQREMDLGNAQPACSPTSGQIQAGGISCSAAQVGTVYFLIGNGGRAIIRNTGGNVVVQENDFCGYIIFDNVNLDCTGAASHPCVSLFMHQQNGGDLSTSGFTNGVTLTGANTGDIGVSCDAQCKVNSGALVTLAGTLGQGISGSLGSMFNISSGVATSANTTISQNVFQILSGSQLIYSGPLTAGATTTAGQIFGVQGNGSSVCIGTLTNSGTFTGARQWAVLNQATLINQSANAVPGSAGLNTLAGFLNGAVIGTSASGC